MGSTTNGLERDAPRQVSAIVSSKRTTEDFKSSVLLINLFKILTQREMIKIGGAFKLRLPGGMQVIIERTCNVFIKTIILSFW